MRALILWDRDPNLVISLKLSYFCKSTISEDPHVALGFLRVTPGAQSRPWHSLGRNGPKTYAVARWALSPARSPFTTTPEGTVHAVSTGHMH